MPSIQYTIRSVPEQVDRYLRKKAEQSGKSLNRIIIDELSEHASLPPSTLEEELGWFIGSGIDKETLKALEEDDVIQKKLAKRDL